ncbi:maleylacetoacetate isomerase [Roseomonas sp. GC11]|uniref:maleylacetoacetate isomerase n=1 Tax=Roseomonas sp. GC11 TaxID=2950546 RepID=UPI00210E1B6E|nr:maleylacetoacetate isomerase [Roseomonas sp. GC11]MCQ4162472.1 maleylacetoacetate isomerase [Roseomonas sp. GC11]
MLLHGYRRCSATWRVQIALALKGLDTAVMALHATLPAAGRPLAAQSGPLLEVPGGPALSQSLAILEWLEEMWPTPALLPPNPATRARVRAFALAIASDVEPLHSRRVLDRLRSTGASEGETQSWARQAISEGLEACEAMLDDGDGPFCFGASPGMADICLVPQLHEARRFGVALGFPRLLAAEAASLTLPAFHETRPDVNHAP